MCRKNQRSFAEKPNIKAQKCRHVLGHFLSGSNRVTVADQ